MPNVQTKTLTSSNLSETFTGAPGPITLDGTFDGGTVTQTLPGSTVAIATFTTADHLFFNAQDVIFTIAGGGGSENVVIRWHRANKPF